MHAKKRRNIVVPILLVLALLAGGVAVYNWSSAPERHDIGSGVIVEGDTLPEGMVATIVENDALPEAFRQFESFEGVPWAKRISQVFYIAPSGPLESPIQAEIPVEALPNGNRPLMALGSPKDGGLNFEEVPIIDRGVRPDGQAYVVVQMEHLSIKAIFEGVTEVIGGAVTKLYDFAGAEVTKEAEQPTCRNEVAMSELIVRIDGSPGALLSCLDRDRESGDLHLHVVNNRRYALSLDPQGMKPIGSGPFAFDFNQFYKRWSANPIVRPREEVVFVVDEPRNPQERPSLKSDADVLSLSASAVESVASIVLQVLSVKADPKSIKAMIGAMEDLRSCGSAGLEDMPANLLPLLRSCATEEVVGSFERVYAEQNGGAKVLPEKSGSAKLVRLVGYAVAVMDVSNMTRTWANFIGDSANGRAKQTIVVQKVDPRASLSGTWERHGSLVEFGADGTARMRARFYDACGPQDPLGNCFFNATLRMENRLDSKASIVFDKVWYTDNNGRMLETVYTLLEDAPRAGDTANVSIDNKNRLVIEYLGRLSGDNDLDGDGVVDDANMYCSSKTAKADRLPCGA